MCFATDIFPPVMPSKILATNNIDPVWADANNAKERLVPKILRSNIGFLPNLSESLPIIGVARNWKNEYEANRKLNPNGLMPNLEE